MLLGLSIKLINHFYNHLEFFVYQMVADMTFQILVF